MVTTKMGGHDQDGLSHTILPVDYGYLSTQPPPAWHQRLVFQTSGGSG